MSQPSNPALEQAVAALRAPGLLARLRDRGLPEGILLLLRVAAGDAQARNDASSMVHEPEAVVVEAAEQFIQQVMFSPGSDSYRVLGVARDADASQIKEHYRWLVRWVHPDRRGDDWNNVYADRVTVAWQDLRTAERRAIYDQRGSTSQQPSHRAIEVPTGPVARSRGALPEPEGFHLSTRAIRRLPVFILCSLLVGAIGLLGLQAYVHQLETDNPDDKSSDLGQAIRPPLPSRLLEPAAAPRPAPIAVATASEVPAPVVMQLPPPPNQPMAVAHIEHADVTVPAPSPRRRQQDASPLLPPPEAPTASPPLRPSSPIASNAEPPQPPPPVLIDEAIAKKVIRQFSSAYASGNINQVRALLANDDPEGKRDRKRLLKSYGELFESSQTRRIEISNAVWLTQGDTAIVIASFDAYVVPRNKNEGRWMSGDIRFDLRRENGELRIVQLRHDIKPG